MKPSIKEIAETWAKGHVLEVPYLGNSQAKRQKALNIALDAAFGIPQNDVCAFMPKSGKEPNRGARQGAQFLFLLPPDRRLDSRQPDRDLDNDALAAGETNDFGDRFIQGSLLTGDEAYMYRRLANTDGTRVKLWHGRRVSHKKDRNANGVILRIVLHDAGGGLKDTDDFVFVKAI